MAKAKHRVKGKIVHVDRQWDDRHLAAGYHEREWGEHSHKDHPLHGTHDTPNGQIQVEHSEGIAVYGGRAEDGLLVLKEGSITHGPEFKITFPDGASVQVLDDESVKAYLRMHGKEID